MDDPVIDLHTTNVFPLPPCSSKSQGNRVLREFLRVGSFIPSIQKAPSKAVLLAVCPLTWSRQWNAAVVAVYVDIVAILG